MATPGTSPKTSSSKTPKKKPWLVAVALGGVASLAGGALTAAPIETPAFEVVAEHDGWEVRQYAPRLEAQVTVRAPNYEAAVRSGFSVLAGFIFGGNEAASSVEMTSPVTASKQTTSTKIAMTAPVGAFEDSDGAWTVSFTMPSKFTAETLPRPTDARVRITEVPGGTWTAARFSGRAAKKHTAVRATLESAMQAHGLEAVGSPEIAQYNPPWTPGPMRRNEILIPVAAVRAPR